ncbi:unnamed protein product [Schistosoma mattheei]|uniref:Uncharacterized protein n=1 Tax=Schistosoma mattheei TaxID=31246 RepID=A0A183PV05_9TREM|nr:unnamed protein product [Schistosoma mattheei]
MVVACCEPEILELGFVLLVTRQQGARVIVRELMLFNGFDIMSPSFTVRDLTTELSRTHNKESIQLRHKVSPQLESSTSKEERKTKEHVTPRNRDRYEKNEQELDRTSKEGPRQSELENACRRPMIH